MCHRRSPALDSSPCDPAASCTVSKAAGAHYWHTDAIWCRYSSFRNCNKKRACLLLMVLKRYGCVLLSHQMRERESGCVFVYLWYYIYICIYYILYHFVHIGCSKQYSILIIFLDHNSRMACKYPPLLK